MERIPIPGYPGCLIANDGTIWGPSGNVLTQRINRDGHVTVTIRGKTRLVHKLLLITFVGPVPSGMETRHLDNNPANNDLSNLEYATHAVNMADKKTFGTVRGEKNPAALLTEEQVREIWMLPHQRAYKVAEKYGLDHSTIHLIWKRKHWGYLDLPELPPQPVRKLTEGNVREILGLRGKESAQSLAKRFNVKYPYIHHLWKGKAWKHLQSAT